MTVGFFSPLPPARTGVADYAAELLRVLKPLGGVAVNSSSADIALYHLGNNRFHREIYRRALEKPGVIVLHDAVLHHFFLDHLNYREYVAEFVYNYGAWTEDLARDMWQNCARSAADPDFFRYPMLKRVVERSLGVVVHNPRAAAIVAEHVAGARVYEIPHLFQAPAQAAEGVEAERLRRQLGLESGAFLLGVFGHLRESKRLMPVLRAFHRARQSVGLALLIAGDFVSRDLARLVEPLIDAGCGIVRVPYLAERDFWRHAAAVDACISLRYPTAGETSGISIRLMGLAKPVLLSAGEETARFPPQACVRIDPGPAEEEMLAEYMVWLARFPGDARAIGQHAAAHIREFHAPARIARLYWDALTDCYHKN
jgi:glycosyltransferase involved in cell wall biosynthesis